VCKPRIGAQTYLVPGGSRRASILLNLDFVALNVQMFLQLWEVGVDIESSAGTERAQWAQPMSSSTFSSSFQGQAHVTNNPNSSVIEAHHWESLSAQCSVLPMVVALGCPRWWELAVAAIV
jgi:hypothetical protein